MMGNEQTKAGLRVTVSLREQSALLTAALRASDEARLRELLSLGLDPESEGLNADWLGMGASLIACEGASMSLGCLRALLDAGASPDACGEEEETALAQLLSRVAGSRCVASGWPEEAPARAKALLAAGADPNALRARGERLLELALKARGDSMVVEGAMEILRALLESGADPNACGLAGSYPPLVIACQNEDLEQVATLLAAGADPRLKARGGRGGSALSFMHSKGNSAPANAIRGMLNSAVERLELAAAVGAEAPGRSPTPRI